jgi:hypothetical protein
MPNHTSVIQKTRSMNYRSSVRQGLILGHKVDHLNAHYFKACAQTKSQAEAINHDFRVTMNRRRPHSLTSGGQGTTQLIRAAVD